MKRCYAVVYLGSAASGGSKWCFAELALARSLGKPIFPVRIEPGARQELVDDLQWVDLLPEPEVGYGRLWRGLERQGIDPRSSFAWHAERSPYPGLASFQEDDAAVFFGRQTDIQALLERIGNTLLRHDERFVAVIGPSGSGKSSLIRAGVIPRLKRQGAPWFVVPPFMPQEVPLEMLARSFAQAFSSLGHAAAWRDIVAQIAGDPGGLVSVARDLLGLASGDQRIVVLVADQGEELVTLSSDSARAEFSRLIKQALIGADVMRVVMTLRSEFLTSVLQKTELASLVSEPFLLGPLARGELPQVIAGPAEIAGLELAPGLVGRIVEDTGGGDALPLMAFTMQRLYQRVYEESGTRRTSKRIEEADYLAVGGVEGALQQRAAAVRDALARTGHGAAVMPTLLKLVGLEQGAAPTRRRVRLTKLSDDEEAVLKAFIDARLVVTDGSGNDAIAFVAHEALMRVWPPFAAAIEDHVDELRERSRLERDALEWVEARRDESYLLRGDRLAQALARSTADESSPLAEFLAASRALRDRALAREADLLANRIIGEYDDDAERAILVALAAIEDYGPRPRLQLALSYAARAPGRRLRLQRDEYLSAIALSPDGRSVAVGQADGTTFVVDDGSGDVSWERRFKTGPHSGLALAFAGLGGEYVAIAYDDEPAVQIVAARTGKRVRQLDLGEHVTAIAGSRRLIVAGGVGGAVHIWQAAPPFDLIHALGPGPRSKIGALDIAADESMIAVGFGPTGYVARLAWDFPEGSRDAPPELVPKATHGDPVKCIRLSPDRTRLVSSAWDDAKVSIWTLGPDDAVPAPALNIATAMYVSHVVWSADGNSVITANESLGLRSWDARTGALLGATVAANPPSRIVVRSGDGSRLGTIDEDHVVSVWDTAGPGPRLRLRIGDAFSQARFADNDRVLVTRSSNYINDESVTVRDARTGKVLRSTKTSRSVSNEITISRDGHKIAIIEEDSVVIRRLPGLTKIRSLPLPRCNHVVFDVSREDEPVTVTFDGVVQRWTADGPATLAEIGEFYAGSLDITPDGRRLLLAGAQKRVVLLDAASGEEIFVEPAAPTGDLHAQIAPDGSCFALGQGDRLRTFAMDGSLLIEFAWGKYNLATNWAAQVGMLAFAPDSRRLATATAEGWVYIWDVASGELTQLLPVDNSPLKDLAFSGSGSQLVVCTAEFEGEYDSTGYAEVWASPTLPELLTLARQRTYRELSAEELAQYGLSRDDASGARSAASMFHLLRPPS